MKGCIIPFLKKDNFEIAENYIGITHAVVAAKVYNSLLLNPTLFGKKSQWLSEKSFYNFRS